MAFVLRALLFAGLFWSSAHATQQSEEVESVVLLQSDMLMSQRLTTSEEKPAEEKVAQEKAAEDQATEEKVPVVEDEPIEEDNEKKATEEQPTEKDAKEQPTENTAKETVAAEKSMEVFAKSWKSAADIFDAKAEAKPAEEMVTKEEEDKPTKADETAATQEMVTKEEEEKPTEADETSAAQEKLTEDESSKKLGEKTATLRQRYEACWDAGSDLLSRDAACAGDLKCARKGYDDRSFGDCDTHCCSLEVPGWLKQHEACWDAGTDLHSRDQACAGDLKCARLGYDGRSFGDCQTHCCSKEVFSMKALFILGEEGTNNCPDGYENIVSKGECKEAVPLLAYQKYQDMTDTNDAQNSHTRPKGCWGSAEWGQVFFNDNLDLTDNSQIWRETRPVCGAKRVSIKKGLEALTKNDEQKAIEATPTEGKTAEEKATPQMWRIGYEFDGTESLKTKQ